MKFYQKFRGIGQLKIFKWTVKKILFLSLDLIIRKSFGKILRWSWNCKHLKFSKIHNLWNIWWLNKIIRTKTMLEIPSRSDVHLQFEVYRQTVYANNTINRIYQKNG